MPKVKVTYVQYRLSRDGSVAIPEKKETYFEDTTPAKVALAAIEFLAEKPVVCCGKTYSRYLIYYEEILPLPPAAQPAPAFLPLGDEFI